MMSSQAQAVDRIAGNDPAGRPVIPLCEPELGGNAARYVQDCLASGWVSSVGAYVDRFERDFAAWLGAAHAVATVNGTAALHVALLAAGVSPEDEVVVSDLTFIAPANAIRYAGAWPVFVDAEPDTWQIDLDLLTEFLDRDCEPVAGGLRNRATGRRVAALLPVHVLGHPVDLDPLLELARRHGLPVVEDAAESLGARYRGRPVGRFGDLACFSFNGNKLITTGGGGMIVTDNPALAERARYLTTTAKDDPSEGVHGAVGYNYRLTNIQAALGCAQIEQLGDLLAAKHRIAAAYHAALAGLPGVSSMPEAPWAESAFWLYSVRVSAEVAGCDNRALRDCLARSGIGTRIFWQPMHRSPAHTGAQVLAGSVADRLYGELLSLPCSCGLQPSDQARVVVAIEEALGL